MDHRELAAELFLSDCNCAQAVLEAFSDVTGLEKGFAAKLASSFGGGMGRMREVCGAVSGMLMVAGLLYGYDDPGENDVNKKAHYRLVQALAGQFREDRQHYLSGNSEQPALRPQPHAPHSGILQDPSLRPYGHDCGGHSGRLHCGAPGHGAAAMNDFIYNQHDIPKEQYRYGLRASADVGCGWVATWNALQILGYKTDIPALIRYYEWQLPLIHGNTGTSFWGPAVCFRKWGFPVKVVVDTKRFDEAAKNADACILFYHWRNKYRFGAHFVALRNTAGGFVGYNTYRNSTGADNYGSSLADFLRKRKYFGAVLLAINRK